MSPLPSQQLRPLHHRDHHHLDRLIVGRRRHLRRKNIKNVDVCFVKASDSIEDNDNHHLNLECNTWIFRNVHPIYYEVATDNRICIDDPSAATATIVPILLLNGFGVGTFHQHRLMRQLLLQSRRHSRSCGEQERSRYKLIPPPFPILT